MRCRGGAPEEHACERHAQPREQAARCRQCNEGLAPPPARPRPVGETTNDRACGEVDPPRNGKDPRQRAQSHLESVSEDVTPRRLQRRYEGTRRQLEVSVAEHLAQAQAGAAAPRLLRTSISGPSSSGATPRREALAMLGGQTIRPQSQTAPRSPTRRLRHPPCNRRHYVAGCP